MKRKYSEEQVSQPLLINSLINSSFFVQAMFDTGFLCLSMIDEALVRRENTFVEQVSSKSLRLADGSRTKISKIARYKLDTDGRQEQLWGYVMPNLAYPIILGKPWMERKKVTYVAGKQYLHIGQGDSRIMVKSSGWVDKFAPQEVREALRNARLGKKAAISYLELSEICNHQSREAPDIVSKLVGAISMHDITKVLEPRRKISKKYGQQWLAQGSQAFHGPVCGRWY